MPGLVDALHALERHAGEIESFYQHSLAYQVRRDLQGADLLRDIFAASVSERRGASEDRGREAIEGFEPVAEPVFTIGQGDGDPETDYRTIFERLCIIPNIDQKIAAMFLKFVVRFFGQWPRFRPHLFVPLDRVVLRSLKWNLQWDIDLPDQSPSVKNLQKNLRGRHGQPLTYYQRFLDIQDRLLAAATEAGTDRILIDELWLIGQLFCREYPLCHACWIHDACTARRR